MYRSIALHIAGMTTAWLVFCLQGIVCYAGLLVSAWATGSDAGGPLAGPVIVLIAAVLGGAVTTLVLLPAVIVGEMVGRLRWLAAFGMVTVLLGAAAAGWNQATAATARVAAIGWLITVAATVLPLTAWSAVATVAGRIRHRRLGSAH